MDIMMVIEQLTLSLLLAIVCAAVPWLVYQVPSRLVAGGLLLGITLSVLGVIVALPLYPWSNLVVLLNALTAGLLLGRVMPPRFRPFLVLLLVLSLLDAVQIALTGGLTPLPSPTPTHPPTTPSGGLLFGNLYLLLPVGHYLLGIFDLLVVTAAAEHWRRRGASYVIALLPGVIGFLLAFGTLWLTQRAGWPLIPFITAGWLGSAMASHFMNGHGGKLSSSAKAAHR